MSPLPDIDNGPLSADHHPVVVSQKNFRIGIGKGMENER
jgi:hypothetical protein